MPVENQSQIAKFALNDILLGIAQGLNDAQNQLRNMPPYDEYGRPNTMYQLPYLDFELKVTSEYEQIINESTDSTETNAGAASTPVNSKDKYPIMYATPRGSFKYSSAKTTQTSNNVQLASTISGRFVANMPNEGLPQIVLMVKVSPPANANTNYRFDIEVTLSNIVGEFLINTLIEFNFDADASQAINGSTAVYSPPSFVNVSELKTDAQGKAIVSILIKKIDYDHSRKNIFIFSIGSGPVKKKISISKS